MEDIDQGYDDSRFEGEVSENFKCPICLNVLKDPLQCRQNEHYFCAPCIQRHLTLQDTCPVCIDPLTGETARSAPRIVTQCLLELKIKCDFVERGCPEVVPLGELPAHVGECGFAPVRCQLCSVVINKGNQREHETTECPSKQNTTAFENEIKKEVDELKNSLARMKGQFQYELNRYQGETRREVDRIKQNVGEIKIQLDDCRRNQERTRVKLVEFRAEFRDEVKRLNARLPSQALVPITMKQAIVIMGGFRDNSGKPTNTVEMYHELRRCWEPVNAMNMRRAEACSVLYENAVIIAGGWTSENATSTIEILNAGHINGPQWKKFPAAMPVTFLSHKCAIYENRMIMTGGWHTEKKCSSGIYELLLEPPYTAKLELTMPEPLCLHAAQVVGNQLFILGGTTTNAQKDCTGKVHVYNIPTYAKPTALPSLPFPISSMATVVWRDKIILLGGADHMERALNTAIVYDSTTGESSFLPRMRQCRLRCSAVVLQDMVVVMGGTDENRHVLSSVECYDFNRCSWEELPPMNEPRTSATAVIVPVN